MIRTNKSKTLLYVDFYASDNTVCKICKSLTLLCVYQILCLGKKRKKYHVSTLDVDQHRIKMYIINNNIIIITSYYYCK